MFILLGFVLAVVAAALIVAGLVVEDGIVLIYLSIATTLLAGVLLLLSIRQERSRPPVLVADDTEPAPVDVAPAEEVAVAPALAGMTGSPGASLAGTGEVAETAADFFPIADYDELTVAEVLPLLPELYADELDVVEQRERAGQGRAVVLGRLAELRAQLHEAPADATAAQLTPPEPATPAVVPAEETPPASVPAKAPAKEPAAKKSPAKKAPAAKKSADTKVPAAKTPAAKKAPAATKAAAKKSPAKKMPAAKKSADTKAKKAPAVKAPVKKAAPAAKKATKATRATKATKVTKKA